RDLLLCSGVVSALAFRPSPVDELLERWGCGHFNVLCPNGGLRGLSGPDLNAAFDRIAIAGFDGLDGVFKCRLQDILADGPEHEPERPSFEVLALAYYDGVHIGRSVGTGSEGVGVARATAPHVGVGGLHDHAVAIGPVIVQSLPYAARALGHIGFRGATVMHL